MTYDSPCPSLFHGKNRKAVVTFNLGLGPPGPSIVVRRTAGISEPRSPGCVPAGQLATQLRRSEPGSRTAAVGHEDSFPPHRPNAGYVIGKETVAGARGSGRDAPIPAVHQLTSGTARVRPESRGSRMPARRFITVSSMLHPSARGRAALC